MFATYFSSKILEWWHAKLLWTIQTIEGFVGPASAAEEDYDVQRCKLQP